MPNPESPSAVPARSPAKLNSPAPARLPPSNARPPSRASLPSPRSPQRALRAAPPDASCTAPPIPDGQSLSPLHPARPPAAYAARAAAPALLHPHADLAALRPANLSDPRPYKHAIHWHRFWSPRLPHQTHHRPLYLLDRCFLSFSPDHPALQGGESPIFRAAQSSLRP